MKKNLKINRNLNLQHFRVKNRKILEEIIDGKRLFEQITRAQSGDSDEMYKVIKRYMPLINMKSRGDEDLKSYIILEFIYRTKEYKTLEQRKNKI